MPLAALLRAFGAAGVVWLAGFWPSLAPETDYGFPSGHAMGSVVVVLTVVILLRATRWRWLALLLGGVFVILVGLSRVYLGVHYPSDMLAGWCASGACVLGARQIWAHPGVRDLSLRLERRLPAS